MQAQISINRKLLSFFGVMLLAITIIFTVGHASAVSASDCDKTANPSECRGVFKQCDQQPHPDQCKQDYLELAREVTTLNAPPESDCKLTLNPQGCQNAYEQCGNKSDKATTQCKKDAITKYQKAPDAGGAIGGPRNDKTCGGTNYDYYTPSIDIGCRGEGNPIADAIFGIIRFLSAGVGLVIVGSMIVGGLQYTGSRGDPQSTAMAVNRLRSSLYALIIFIFAYAILNYIIPAGFLK
jgi:hypothetical protein